MKEKQASLGHSDYSTTTNLYTHLHLGNAMVNSTVRFCSNLFGTDSTNKSGPSDIT